MEWTQNSPVTAAGAAQDSCQTSRRPHRLLLQTPAWETAPYIINCIALIYKVFSSLAPSSREFALFRRLSPKSQVRRRVSSLAREALSPGCFRLGGDVSIVSALRLKGSPLPRDALKRAPNLQLYWSYSLFWYSSGKSYVIKVAKFLISNCFSSASNGTSIKEFYDCVWRASAYIVNWHAR